MSQSSLVEADYQALADFRFGLRKFLRFSKEFLVAEGKLTPEQYEALLAIKAFPGKKGLLIGELSHRLQVKHHTAVSLAEKLVRRKLVSRRRGTSDRRKVYLTLTQSGTTLIARLAKRHRDELRGHVDELIAALRAINRH
jgi:DNA-binding MarR family transcriptional regulator